MHIPVERLREKRVKKVKSKILEKTTRYVTSGMIVADEFRVGVVFSTGG